MPLTPTLTAPLAHAWPAAQSWVTFGTVAPVIVPMFWPMSPPPQPKISNGYRPAA